MNGFTKLFQNIVTSSIWGEDDKTRIVWITMLALASREGVVEASVSGMATLSRVSKEDCEKAILRLEAPDSDSRSKEHDGRRIEKCDGGWRILNHGKYRSKLSLEERREYLVLKQREYREKKRQLERGLSTVQIIKRNAESEAFVEQSRA